MKDSDGFLPKGWMMHEPYNLRNGTPALAIYTYLYRTTRKNAWQGSLQTLSDIVEIHPRTVRNNLLLLQSRGLVSIEPLAYSHYSIKAQRLTNDTPEVGISDKVVGISGKVVGISGTEVGICDQPIKYNININKNINTNHSGGVSKEPSSPSATTANDGLSRKDYIAKVLSVSVPEYPFTIVYEYAAIVGIDRGLVDNFIIHYEQSGWRMKNGGKISNWAAALKNWANREKRFAERDAKFTQRGLTPMCKNAGQPQMSEANRAAYEEEQRRKKAHREQLDRESEQALTFEEWQALKERLRS